MHVRPTSLRPPPDIAPHVEPLQIDRDAPRRQAPPMYGFVLAGLLSLAFWAVLALAISFWR